MLTATLIPFSGGFLATCYVLLGRLAVHLDAQDCLLIRASLISKILCVRSPKKPASVSEG